MKDRTKSKSKQSKKPQKTRFIFGRDMAPDQILGAIKKMAKGAGIKVVKDRARERPKSARKKKA